MTLQPLHPAPYTSADSQPPQQKVCPTPLPGPGAGPSTGAGRKGWLRQTLSHLPAPLSLSAAPLAALLVLAPTPPALAETCRNLSEIKSSCTILNLAYDDLRSLSPDIFRGLNNLQKLRLQNNGLSSLPPNIFRDLNNLQELSILFNNLSSLPPNIFRDLNNLQELNLSVNNLSSIPPDTFRGLNNLQKLYLDRNPLSSLSPDSFRGLNNLQELSLRNSLLSSLSPDIFRGLNNLKKLDLSDSAAPHIINRSNISSLPPDTFRGLNNLQELRLSRNISILSPGSFRGLNSLPELDLRFNNISSLPPDTFSGLNNLQKLNLRGNRLSSLPPDTFSGLNNLQELDLEGNRLSSLPSDIFSPLTNLQELLLWGNRLSSLPSDIFSPLTNLQKLYLSSNPLKSLPSDIFKDNFNLSQLLMPSSLICLPDVPPGWVKTGPNVYRTPGGSIIIYVGSGPPERCEGEEPEEPMGPDETEPDETEPDETEPDETEPMGPDETEPDETEPDETEPDETEPEETEEKSFLDDLGDELLDAAIDGTKNAAEEIAEKKILDKAAKKAKTKLAKTVLKIGAKVVPFVGPAITLYDTYTTIKDLYKDSTSYNYDYDYDSNPQLNSLVAALYHNRDALQNGSLSWDQALSGQQFTIPLQLSQTSPPASASASDPAPFNALLKGNVDFSRFNDSSTDFHFDGSTTSYQLGLEVLPNPDLPLVAGLQLALTRSHSDFEDREINTEGAYDLQLFTLHPSIIWDVTDRFTLWSSVGYGRGETELTIDGIDDDRFDFVEGSSRTSSGDFFSVAAGTSLQVWESNASSLHLKLHGSTATFLDTEVQQGRLAAQLSRDIALTAGSLSSAADLALVLSNSDTSAMELSGGLDWRSSQGRWSGSTSARVLLFGDDRSEWGISGGLSLLPGQRGEGLSLSLQPSFGQSGANKLHPFQDSFSFDPDDLALDSEPLTASFQAKVAYGFLQQHALLTPYSQLNLAEHSTTYGAGLRYQLADSLDLDLSASHRQRTSGNNDNRLFLRLRTDL